MRDSTARLQRAARERADEEARRIPWQRLYEVRNQYIDWQEFNLWARSILEVEERIIDWLAEILQNRCPGFLETEKALPPKAAKTRPLVLRLEDWIEDHVFGLAKQEGSFFASTYYAVRDLEQSKSAVLNSLTPARRSYDQVRGIVEASPGFRPIKRVVKS